MCSLCKGMMAKTDKRNVGGVTYTMYECPKCHRTIARAEG